ncbi:hypothetical protein A1O7_02853 [Cladophialophora yegresii CBS 114405]|uniref:Uncharacterized protein n=1 Tax=Cladophialophora yegresii CBS 114405 TaxID=1182544 RepID=W9W3A4_9EURO|nr:uncharacterized protein A1O7_02853 [Cladophialophora yegresii CBS 114405]EXJ62418.1 hypothetical protein A1O7_02853 [Cladophialophora yegresii CBS 114405]
MSPASTSLKVSLIIVVPPSIGFPLLFVTPYLPHPQHRALSWALVLARRTSHNSTYIPYSRFDSGRGSPAPEIQEGFAEDKTFENDVSSNLWLMPYGLNFSRSITETEQVVVDNKTFDSDVPSNLWLVPYSFDFTSSISESAEESFASSSSGSPSALLQFSVHSQGHDTTTRVSSPVSTHWYSDLRFQRDEHDGVRLQQALEEKLALENRLGEVLAENGVLWKKVNTLQRLMAIGVIRLRKSEVEAQKWKSLAGYKLDESSAIPVPHWKQEPAAQDLYAENERLESHLERQDRALHHTRREIHHLEEVVAEKETQITLLNNEIDQLHLGVGRAYDVVEVIIFRFNWLEQHCTDPIATHERLANQNLALQHQVQNLEHDLEDAQNQNNVLAIDDYAQLDAQRHHLQIENAELRAEKRELTLANTNLKAQMRKAKVSNNVKGIAKSWKLKVETQARLKNHDETRKIFLQNCFSKTLDQNKNVECEATSSGEEPQAELRDYHTAKATCDSQGDFFDHKLAPLPHPLPESFRVYRSVEEDVVEEEDEDDNEEPNTDGGVLDLVRLINMLTIEDELDLIT